MPSLRVVSETIWLSQLEIVELSQTSKQNVSLHAKNIFADKELSQDLVIKESLTTASDGKNYHTKLYNLDLILAVVQHKSQSRRCCGFTGAGTTGTSV